MEPISPSDEAFLFAIGGRPKAAAPLSVEQEALLDAWVSGGVGTEQTREAAQLVRTNRFARDFVLGKRLQWAASQGPPVPEALSRKILADSRRQRAGPASGWRVHPQRFGFWQVMGSAAAVTAAILAFVFAGQLGRLPEQAALPEQTTDRVQIAMATLSDRSALAEVSDVVVRGGATPPASSEKRYIAEVNIPTEALREAVSAASTGNISVAPPKLASVLQSLALFDKTSPTFVVLDSEIGNDLSAGTWGNEALIRIYDLNAPQNMAIRKQIAHMPEGRKVLILVPAP
jgi:hypothetical protein